MEKEKKKLIVDGKRVNGRGFDDLRPLKVTAGVLKRADGSAMIEWGRNKVLAAVYGPREVFPKHLSDVKKAIINCRYSMAPFSGMEEHGRSGPNRRAIEIGKVAKHVFENAVLTHQFPKTQIDISMEVLQSDGGTRVAAITAASVALADAGIPMRDLVQGVSIGRVEGQLIVDLDKYEDNLGEADVPLIVSLRSKEVLLFQQDGRISREELQKMFELGFKGAELVRDVQVQALRQRYFETGDELNNHG
ncbi:exosome complex exonuclease Rrp41 [Candidatus Micrarchaeota archaeon]|nr:exosome complex exonuclease Rrp41 [Candidatus Micrarchaeota archaeon]